jgi:hypothetical protein
VPFFFTTGSFLFFFFFLVALFLAFCIAKIGFRLLALVITIKRAISLASFSRALGMPKSSSKRTRTNKKA